MPSVLEIQVPGKMAKVASMDVDAIRSRFIQENLRRALSEQDRQQARCTLHAFRLYFQWFESRIPTLEKLSIASQLARLREAYVNPVQTASADYDGVRHHPQETSLG